MEFCNESRISGVPSFLSNFRIDVGALGNLSRKVLVFPFLSTTKGAGAAFPPERIENPTKRWKLSPMDVDLASVGWSIPERNERDVLRTNVPQETHGPSFT